MFFQFDLTSPFVRLRSLLAGLEPEKPPILMSIGEPQHPVPDFTAHVLARHTAEFGRYPIAKGIEPFRTAAATYLQRRFALPAAPDPERQITVLNGSREGLFLAARAAWDLKPIENPAILLPNPFYPAYAAASIMTGAEPVYVPARQENNFFPDYQNLPSEIWQRTVAVYLASPSNPQGSVASKEYLSTLLSLARHYGAMVFADECYTDIYDRHPPTGILECAGSGFDNVVVFHSLSKRSSLPGLRCGFAAGDTRFIDQFLTWRNVAAPQVPVPLQHVAAQALSDEEHVAENRRLYRDKIRLSQQMLEKFGFAMPQAGFFLWLDVSRWGSDEEVTRLLWQKAGIQALPGSYLAQDTASGNPGRGYIRLALVQPVDTTEQALERVTDVFNKADVLNRKA